jgi:peptide/nickel transport system substrate-binding protein
MKSKNRTHKLIRFSVVFLASFFLLIGISAQAHAGGVMRLAMIEDALSLDPIIPSDNASIWTVLLIFDQLVRTGVDGKTLEPGLAEKWDISEDGIEYTFYLRDAKFSTGEDVTANDVAYSLERAAGEESRWASFFKPIKKVEVVDKKTVKIILHKPFTPMLSNLALWSASIVSKSAVEKEGKNFANNPIGSGPFRLEKWSKGDKIVIAKNAYYWQKGKPYLDKVELLIVPEDNARMLKIQSGEVDVAASVPFNMIESLKRMKDMEIQVVDVLRSDFILMNTTKKPLDDVRVRRALNCAADKEGIIKSILFGMGKVAKSTLPIMRHYNHDIEPYPYNIEMAKELLDKAGYPKGFSAELIVISGDPVAKQAAVIIQDSFRKIGIDLRISLLEGGTHWQTTKSGKYDLALSYCTSDTIDPDQIVGFTMITPGRADAYHTRFKDERVNELFEKARITPEGPEREQMYKEIQKRLHDAAPYIFLYHIPAVYAFRSNVKNFKVLPTSNYRLEEVQFTGQ